MSVPFQGLYHIALTISTIVIRYREGASVKMLCESWRRRDGVQDGVQSLITEEDERVPMD